MFNAGELTEYVGMQQASPTGTDQEEDFDAWDIVRYPVAATVDLATSIADSFTGGYCENVLCDTEKALSAVDELFDSEVSDFYEDNQELVELTSFVGGILVPGMAIAKGLKMAQQTGTMLPRAFSSMERAKQVHTDKALASFKKLGKQSDDYQDAMRDLRKTTIAQGVAEALVFEVGFLATMNGHAYIEDNYDVGDFALGVSIGSMVGPIAWMIKNKAITKELTSLDETQKKVTQEAYNVLYAAENTGDTITNSSVIYRDTAHIDASGLSQGEIDEVVVIRNHSLVDTYHQVEKAMHSSLPNEVGTGLGKVDNYEDVVDSLGYTFGQRFAASPKQLLTRIAIDQTGVFSGVNSFARHTEEIGPLVDDVINNIYIKSSPGQMMALDGNTAAKALVPDFSHKPKVIADLLKDFDSATIPAGVRITTDNENGRMVNVVEVDNSKIIEGDRGKEFRSWFIRYANTEDMAAAPMLVRSRDGHLKGMQTAILKSELEGKESAIWAGLKGDDITSSQGRFITPAELDKIVDTTADYGVIIPALGHTMISSSSARIAMVAAGDASVIVNPRANAATLMTGGGKFDPFSMNTQTADGGWLEVKYAVDNDKGYSLANHVIDSDSIRGLQAAFIHLVNAKELETKAAKALTFRVKQGKEILKFNRDNIPKLSKLLVQEKARVAQAIVNKGGAYEQAAIYTNMNLSDIEKLHASGWNVTDNMMQEIAEIGVYTKDAASVYHNAMPIKVLGKHRKYADMDFVKGKSVLDQNIVRDIHTSIIKHNVATAGLDDVGEMLEATVWNGAYLTMRDNLEKLLVNVATPSRFLASADQALRGQGLIGDIVATFGQNFVKMNNDQWTTIAKGVINEARAVAHSPTDALQFEQLKRAIQKNTKYAVDFEPDTGKFALRDQFNKIGGNNEQIYLEYIEGGEIVATPTMANFMNAYIPVAKNMYQRQNLARKNAGLPALPDNGVWFPYEAVEDKFIAFQVNKKNPHDVYIITGNSTDDLRSQLSTIRENTKIMSEYNLVTRNELSNWNDLLDIAALTPMTRSESGFKKGGIAIHTAKTDGSGLDDLLGQLQATLWRTNRQVVKQAGAEVFQKLESAAEMFDDLQKSGPTNLMSRLGQKTSIPEIAYKTMLNTSLMNKSPRLQWANDMTTASINQSLTASARIWAEIKGRSGKDIMTADDFAEFGRKAEAEGIPLPWQNVEQFLKARNMSLKSNMAEHRVAQVNGIAATMNLRLMEASHAILTVLSAPVVLSSQLANNNMPLSEFIKTAKWMMKGGEDYKEVIAEARHFGYAKSMVSEASELMGSLLTAKTLGETKFQKTLRILSKPSDNSEMWTREFAYAMGYRIARQKGITEKSLLRASAATFTMRAMGNYVSRQRPVLFQGTMGSIIGLYQTFMVTMGQNMYRYVEEVDKKALGYMLGSQTGMWGLESLPMYHPFNRMLGEYMSDDNENITTEVHKAMGNGPDQGRNMAEFLLYGVPSTMFQAGFFTRGELQPRAPLRFEEGIGFNPAAFNNIMQSLDFAKDLVTNVGNSIAHDGSVGDWGRAAAQSLSIQSVWRPGARISEVVMGRSFDRKGEEVDSFTSVGDVLTDPLTNLGEAWPLVTRILASRPLKETMVRNMKFNASYFNQADRASRGKVVRQIRRHASFDAEMSDESHASLLEKYMDESGSIEGWKAINKQAYMEANTSYGARQQRLLKHQEGWVSAIEDAE